ncbi:hypothetical protein H0E87_031389 [Populus deltoides]|uniref:Uncharacterized protein n=1 Tax=Populus deltoides TaxID=3696 RepID=A0A8T2WAB7_POPDE|nr:hypothetical protein H0E87_031389 [Populus deltoides]
MEQTPGEEIGIRIYTASPQNEPKATKISTGSPQNDEPRAPKPLCNLTKAPKEPGTLLTFEMLLPSISRNGVCTPVTALMIHVLLGLCSVSCFLFHFTDSFKGPDDKIYYGFVTTKGLAVFNPGLTVDVPKGERYKIGFTDFVHAMMSVMVFMAIALSDHRVTDCLFPGHVKEMDEVMESFPLMVGVICSGLFLVFPTSRHGIGCMAN